MSNEPRLPDQIISVRAPRINGTIQHGLLPKMRVELFGAYQFRTAHNRKNRNFYPRVPIKKQEKEYWYRSMFRLRINGKWYGTAKAKYHFYSMGQVIEVLL